LRYASIPCVAGGAREWDGVAHVGKVGDVGEGAPEAATLGRTVAPEIRLPGVLVLVDAALGHAAIQHLEPLLALAAADDLADSRHQYVHRRDTAAVIVQRTFGPGTRR
jgi:hypothetical protein